MEKEVRSFEDLEAYKACREFRLYIHSNILPILLEQKQFDLHNQLTRSSRSITANIAEGYGRYHYLDNSKFCIIARGELHESLEHIITAQDEGILNDIGQERINFTKAAKILNGYISYLQRQAIKK